MTNGHFEKDLITLISSQSNRSVHFQDESRLPPVVASANSNEKQLTKVDILGLPFDLDNMIKLDANALQKQLLVSQGAI